MIKVNKRCRQILTHRWGHKHSCVSSVVVNRKYSISEGAGSRQKSSARKSEGKLLTFACCLLFFSLTHEQD